MFCCISKWLQTKNLKQLIKNEKFQNFNYFWQ